MQGRYPDQQSLSSNSPLRHRTGPSTGPPAAAEAPEADPAPVRDPAQGAIGGKIVARETIKGFSRRHSKCYGGDVSTERNCSKQKECGKEESRSGASTSRRRRSWPFWTRMRIDRSTEGEARRRDAPPVVRGARRSEATASCHAQALRRGWVGGKATHSMFASGRLIRHDASAQVSLPVATGNAIRTIQGQHLSSPADLAPVLLRKGARRQPKAQAHAPRRVARDSQRPACTARGTRMGSSARIARWMTKSKSVLKSWSLAGVRGLLDLLPDRDPGALYPYTFPTSRKRACSEAG